VPCVTILQGFGNRLQNALGVVQYVVVPKAQNSIAVISEPVVAANVAFIFGMLSAVDLNDQAQLPADEVDDVRSDGLLPNEFRSAK
jgi:hypothetical protein